MAALLAIAFGGVYVGSAVVARHRAQAALCQPARERQVLVEVEALGVDGLDLPRPRISAGYAMAAGKPGHTRQRHGGKLSVRG